MRGAAIYSNTIRAATIVPTATTRQTSDTITAAVPTFLSLSLFWYNACDDPLMMTPQQQAANPKNAIAPINDAIGHLYSPPLPG